MLTSGPRGTHDITPSEMKNWRRVEKAARDICDLYHYGEIRTPIFEHTELFLRGIGETTDVVQKEMYTLPIVAAGALLCVRKIRRPWCGLIWNKNCMRIRRQQNCFTLAPCFAMIGHRQDVFASSISSESRRSDLRALRWMPRSSCWRYVFLRVWV